MKKAIYIILAGILGVLLSFLAHALIEIPVIWLLLKDFEKYSFGLDWSQILTIHSIFTILLLILGVVIGVRLGFRWWKYIYVDKKYTGRLFKIKE